MAPAASSPTKTAQLFAEHRAHLLSVAYRMLGSFSDAEDVLQEAFLRLGALEGSTLESPRAYLTKVVSRLCLDYLKSARVRREAYVGPWLPEPMLAPPDDKNPGQLMARKDDISMALLLALERLSPLERAAFLLHDVFDLDYAEIAEALDRPEGTCRVLAARGRKRVRDAKPRFSAPIRQRQRLVSTFAQSIKDGDVSALQALLTDDVRLVPDGGGRVSSARHILHGKMRVARFLLGVQKRFRSYENAQLATVGGVPGLVVAAEDSVTQVTAFDMTDGKISAIFVVRNPDKLAHLGGGASKLVAAN